MFGQSALTPVERIQSSYMLKLGRCSSVILTHCTVINVESRSVCVSKAQMVAVYAVEYSYCVQQHMQHLNTALCDTAWGYDAAGRSSVAIFTQAGRPCSDLSRFIPISRWNHKVLQSDTPSSSSMTWNDMIPDGSISCSSVKLYSGVIS